MDFEGGSRMDELISRRMALQAMDTWDKFGCDPDGKLVRCDDDKQYVPYVHYDDMVHVIKALPSVESEIIRCKDCKYSSDDEYCHCSKVTWWNSENDFCSRAERGTDE